jgi:ATP-dependent Clp protease protease subunit
MNKFWNWIRDDTGGRVLRLEGPIDSESFWGDEITPQMFRDELEAEEGDLTVWINSPGGNVFAAAEIYTMLREYAGAVTVRIASIAASAASVVAMAGNRVEMSPTALLMIHDPSTIAMGNAKDMEKAIETLNEVKESIINAYAAKTGLRHNKIAELMSNETWMNAKKAVELGFADEVLYDEKKVKPAPDEDEDDDDPDKKEKDEGPVLEAQMYSSRMMDQTILNRLRVSDTAEKAVPPSAPTIGMDGKTENGETECALSLRREGMCR